MRASHSPTAVSATFDEPNLVSCAGLVPVMRLAERVGLGRAASELVRVPGSAGAHAGVKVSSIVAGMLAGGDSIDDLDVIRHGALPELFDGGRAPSTLGTFLRGFTWGHVRQLDAVARRCVVGLSEQTPLLAGAETFAFLDLDSTIEQVYGYAKQGAEYGYTHVRGLHPLVATLSTPIAAPVIAGTRLRRGAAGSAKGAASFVSEALRTARAAGATATLVVRADSAFYSRDVIAACRRAGARFSITAIGNCSVRAAIAAIPENAWVPIKYPHAIYDESSGQWISDAEIAETSYTAFNNRNRNTRVTARLIVRRVKDKNTPQEALFPLWRYHACFTDNPADLLTAEKQHRAHAIVEQVIADMKDGAAAHLPSGRFAANAAWLTLAALAFNLTRAAGTLASRFHARARTGTIRRHLITVPARITRSARRIRLRLPTTWPWAPAWHTLFTASHAPSPP
jgi:DDE family transposase